MGLRQRAVAFTRIHTAQDSFRRRLASTETKYLDLGLEYHALPLELRKIGERPQVDCAAAFTIDNAMPSNDCIGYVEDLEQLYIATAHHLQKADPEAAERTLCAGLELLEALNDQLVAIEICVNKLHRTFSDMLDEEVDFDQGGEYCLALRPEIGGEKYELLRNWTMSLPEVRRWLRIGKVRSDEEAIRLIASAGCQVSSACGDDDLSLQSTPSKNNLRTCATSHSATSRVYQAQDQDSDMGGSMASYRDLCFEPPCPSKAQLESVIQSFSDIVADLAKCYKELGEGYHELPLHVRCHAMVPETTQEYCSDAFVCSDTRELPDMIQLVNMLKETFARARAAILCEEYSLAISRLNIATYLINEAEGRVLKLSYAMGCYEALDEELSDMVGAEAYSTLCRQAAVLGDVGGPRACPKVVWRQSLPQSLQDLEVGTHDCDSGYNSSRSSVVLESA
ncbi:hypothetical protein CERZMDRAFT_83403 [Cercospora zeae-maydis SCOH1-5]|uniref:Uncharacterized protein n=1 Tax=Cercospora zeae-maydis SCOH1-5 TaxID=717836 RepID=A0A6A6FKT2_9PEZI|nr:hypothetical protein CERZMDRAFT_83403 [Cercospora zeae-maydis SCOH1-5]